MGDVFIISTRGWWRMVITEQLMCWFGWRGLRVAKALFGGGNFKARFSHTTKEI